MKYTSTCIAVSRLHSNSVALVLDDLHDLRDVLLAGIVVGSLHHHTHDRLRARLAHQNTTGIAQCFSHSLDCLLHRRVVLCSFLVSYTDILQNLPLETGFTSSFSLLMRTLFSISYHHINNLYYITSI